MKATQFQSHKYQFYLKVCDQISAVDDVKGKGKGNVLPITGHEGSDGE
jgi:hypothetical protein